MALYQQRLLADPGALAYVQARGLSQTLVERYRLGYAGGDELADLLRWRRLSIRAARGVGLLGRDGREFLAGRVVVPEFRDGRPIWLVGRAVAPRAGEPKYLGLPGRKPLLGWEAAQGQRVVCLTEGVFDWLALCAWSVTALCLVGTHAGPDALSALTRFEQVYLAFDRDAAGEAATRTLMRALEGRGVPIALPELPGVKDVADLALRPDGRPIFAGAVQQAVRAAAAHAPPAAAA